MRFGIIGCGTIAQIMHIPYVVESPDAELFALADPAADRVSTLGDRYDVPHRFESADELVAEIGSAIDAVIVLTPPNQHANVVETTLGADVHTLVEKPLAVSPSDADRMTDAAESSDATAMVAYMKRYDPAMEQMQAEVNALDDIDLVTAYDVDPDHGRIIDEVYDVVDGDVPVDVIEESSEKQTADSIAAIGVDDTDLAANYHWHLEHVCHDVNVLRGLLGDVRGIEHVDLFADGRYATAHLIYEGGIRCTLDSGLSERKWFEEFVRVDAPDRSVTLEFGNPYIKNVPSELEIKQGVESLSTETRVPTYDESFRREIAHFVACVRGEADVRTTFAEARDDVYLIADLFRTHLDEDRLNEY